MNAQARAILWAQARSVWNYFPRSNKGGLIFGVLVSIFWYGMWLFFAFIGAKILSDPAESKVIGLALSGGLLLVFLYWQIIPVLMATTGASLDIKKLMIYPIPHSQLFAIELLLRTTTGIEMLLILSGIYVGLMANPNVPKWGPLGLVLFVAFNLCCAAGLREILARLFARKRVREIAVFLLVLCGALPQLLIATGGHSKIAGIFQGYNTWWFPWSAAASMAQGQGGGKTVAVLTAWAVLSYVFGRNQFERGLSFDADVLAPV